MDHLDKGLNKDYIQSMRYSTQVKPISYVKANAAQVLRELAESRETLVITQNGEAAAVMQDVATYEADQQALALLKILALGNQQIAQGKVVPAANAVARVRARRAADQ
jgi:prevent-host-death family protein